MNKNEAKILIVDDIEDNRYTLERSLKKMVTKILL